MIAFRYVKRFAELGLDAVPEVGGKNASLGEMVRELRDRGVKVPNGFATTAEAYRRFLAENGLDQAIQERLRRLDPSDTRALAETGATIRGWIEAARLPDALVAEIEAAYDELCAEYGTDTDVAIRSSATAEDLPDASFAGQQETHLNIRGLEAIRTSCRQIFASLYTDRAISYRVHRGFIHEEVALSLGIQKMVRADRGTSGVMFTLDTESGFRDVVFITAAYGLGENVVQGAVNPDEFYVFKPTLEQGFRPILRRRLGSKAWRMIYGDVAAGEAPTRNIPVEPGDQARFCIDDEDCLTLARFAMRIEAHYSEQAGQPRPMDIEWAKDGETGEVFIVQARPETVQSTRDAAAEETFRLEARGEVIARGKSIGTRIASGRARVIDRAGEMHALQPGEILITDMTDPDWEPVMKIAGAIVTNRGGRTCHAAIIARELGIPAVVGTGDAAEQIADGDAVTVSCAEGDTGFVYRGELPFHVDRASLADLPRPRTHIMLNLANPDAAFDAANLPCEGVGLARLEFIINNTIQVHPRALLEYDQLPAELQRTIASVIAGYPSPTEYYVERLAEGIAILAAAFYPRPVIVRLSDFKSNEYAALIGGDRFEPTEENPMIGFRGASRYDSPAFAEAFGLECQALKRVREVKGLDNVRVMIPFVRTVAEERRVLEVMAQHGLRRGENGLQVVLMCEIPANAILAEEFLEHCDGFSIGSNDLTQLTLGADRDSGLLAGYDERNPAVLKLAEFAIEACHRQGKYIGICGQAPSDFPEITEWLVRQGIDSMSLNPDSVLRMTRVVLETEAQLEPDSTRSGPPSA
jgi:pyruvate,water dikinase